MTDPMPGPTSHSFFSQRLRLHYVDWGNPTRPPLLLLHGGRDHCRNWDWTAAALREDWHIIAPDLRGHGDSQWSTDGSYTMPGYVYDLVQLIHQQKLAPVTIIAHSLGGNITLRYAGIYPETVARLVVIEGLGPGPARLAEYTAKTIVTRFDEWIGEQRRLAARLPRRYATIEEALKRMQEENPHLTAEQARHLTAAFVARSIVAPPQVHRAHPTSVANEEVPRSQRLCARLPKRYASHPPDERRWCRSALVTQRNGRSRSVPMRVAGRE